MKKMSIVLTLILMAATATVAGAQTILWDQTAGYEGWSMGFFNNIAGGPPMGSTMYTVNDVTVPETWTIHRYTVYYDGFDPTWAGSVTSAVFYIEPKTGSTPTGDPASGVTVPVVCEILGNGFMTVTALELDEVIPAGDYWMGLTPMAPNANNIHVSVTAVGDDSPTWDAFGFPMPMWGAWSPGLDGAIQIEGSLGVVPNEEASWGDVKNLYR